ncbi:MAG: S8 family serine peptidase, partial [Chloroflexota bacterium]|nr:S8 family serine peptidase [Chloroflexota bacterium]
HGTHGAGTIGARGGIVGGAPGTPIRAFKVLGDSGFGSLSAVICGLEWVIDTLDDTGVVAINLSLGAPMDDNQTKCGSSSFHQAICNTKRAGVAIVVAAGNDNKNARGYVPAAYSQVITVAAMTDTDGCAGGRGGHSSWGSRDRDDRKWIRSNFGSVVDVIAPGVDIESTAHDGGYRELSGTSMAAPHVTGAIARGWDPGNGGRERNIPGFKADQGLVKLSSNTGCGDEPPVDPGGQPADRPKLTIKPETAAPRERVRVMLRGFPAGDTVRILLKGEREDRVVTNGNGAGSGKFRVPSSREPGRYVVRAVGKSGTSDSAKLRIRD